jgi:uncharacterized protein (UPF0332 family)
MSEWSGDLVLHRLRRAEEALDDARILAEAARWNACVNRLYYSSYGLSGYQILLLCQKFYIYKFDMLDMW